MFLKASAVIMETGGFLSHGAIVAREYGIPAVVNIPGVMLEKEEKTLCLYTQGNGYYVEEPYIGVYKYKSDRKTNAGIYKIFNDRRSGATSTPEPLRKLVFSKRTIMKKNC